MYHASAIRLATAAVTVLLLAGSLCAQTSIRLNARAQVVPGASVKLADVAVVTGTEADRLGALVILPTSSGSGEVNIAAVRAALKQQSVNWAAVTLSGSRCVLEVEKGATPSPRTTAPSSAPPESVHEPIDPDASTMRGMVGRRLAEFYNVPADDLRVRFSASGKADPLLFRNIEDGERVEIQPAGTAGSGRLPVRITILDDKKIVASGAVTAEVLIRRETVNLISPVDRDEIITASNLRVQTVWLPPSALTPLTLELATGRTAGRKMPAGETLDASDVQSVANVRKGDEIVVRCIVGTISIETRAYALTDGKVGETIPMAVDKTKDRKPFMAQLTSRGTAIRIDSSHQAPLPNPVPATQKKAAPTSSSASIPPRAAIRPTR